MKKYLVFVLQTIETMTENTSSVKAVQVYLTNAEEVPKVKEHANELFPGSVLVTVAEPFDLLQPVKPADSADTTLTPDATETQGTVVKSMYGTTNVPHN